MSMPMTKDHKKSQEYYEGYNARYEEIDEDQNPHPDASQQGKDWLEGWEAADYNIVLEDEEDEEDEEDA